MKKYFRERLIWFKKKLDDHSDELIYYLLFLRITPLLPNWFINISSPILDVPLSKFFLATFIGLMPMNLMHVQTGMMLNDVDKVGGFDPKVCNLCFNLSIDHITAICSRVHSSVTNIL